MYHDIFKYHCLDLIINLRLEIQHACLHVQQYIKMVFCERLDFIEISFCHSVPYGLLCYHDDVIKWKHFPCHWPFLRGIHWSPELFFFFFIYLNKRLSKHSWRRWFGKPSRSSCRHCNGQRTFSGYLQNTDLLDAVIYRCGSSNSRYKLVHCSIADDSRYVQKWCNYCRVFCHCCIIHRQISNIRRTLVGN